MEIGIIGSSIWQQNMPLLERLTIARDSQVDVLRELKSILGVSELIYLATCNRVEFLYATENGTKSGPILHRLIDFFFQGKRDIGFFPNDFYHYTGKEAIAHLFRTTSSLESLVVGETQITGQFRQALQTACDSGLTGPALNSLAKEALQVAKKVKRETSIGEGCLSMASLAASTLLASLNGRSKPRIALVGSGTMTVKLAKQIRKTSSAELFFINRTIEKVEQFAREYDGEAVSLEEFLDAPAVVDAIVSATASSEPVFDKQFLARLEQNDRDVVCIDLAVPGDFSGDYIDAPSIHLINISELKSRGQGNLREKFVEVSKANEIVRDSVNKYLSNRIEVSLKPIFHDSYRESVALAQQAFDDLFSKRVTGLGRDEQEAVLRLVNKLISHSSFQPVKKLSDHLVEKRAELSLADSSAVSKKAV